MKGVSFLVDSWPEILIVCASACSIVGMVLMTIRKSKRLKVSTPLGSLDSGEEKVKSTTLEVKNMDEILSSTMLLQQIADSQKAMAETIGKLVARFNLTDEVLGGVLEASAIQLKFIRRELGRNCTDDHEINGDLDDAEVSIRKARDDYRKGRRMEP